VTSRKRPKRSPRRSAVLPPLRLGWKGTSEVLGEISPTLIIILVNMVIEARLAAQSLAIFSARRSLGEEVEKDEAFALADKILEQHLHKTNDLVPDSERKDIAKEILLAAFDLVKQSKP
jgi:hypothetical protein